MSRDLLSSSADSARRSVEPWSLREIELQQLAGPIDRALIGPPALEQRPDLTQVVIEDRLCPGMPQRLDQLADALAGDPRIVLQQAVDLVLERVELRRSRRALIAGRALAPQRATHGVAVRPVRLTISWIESPSTSFIRLISAQRRTSSTAFLLASHTIWRGSTSRRTTPTTHQVGAISTGPVQ